MTSEEFEVKLAVLDNHLTPPNSMELELGMFLTALIDIVECYDDEGFDPEELDYIVVAAQETLKLWTPKYQEFIAAIKEAKKNAK